MFQSLREAFAAALPCNRWIFLLAAVVASMPQTGVLKFGCPAHSSEARAHGHHNVCGHGGAAPRFLADDRRSPAELALCRAGQRRSVKMRLTASW